MQEIKLEDIKGVGKITAEKLRNAGIDSVQLLAIMNPEELEEIAGIDPLRAAKLIREARRLLKIQVKARPALLSEEEVLKYSRLTTGVAGIDELLGGGLEHGSIYEFAGEFGSGKTQLCHQLSVTAQLNPDSGGVEGKVYYIDTEGTFSHARIRKIAERFSLDPDEALRNIFLVRVETVVALEEAVREEAYRLVENENVKLVIIDSIIALYRAQFRGMQWLARRQQRLNYVLDWLKRLGRVYKPLYIAITNQVLSNPMPSGIVMKVPAGGNIIAHASTHRLIIRKAGDKHIIQVLDSPYLPRKAEAVFKITENGVEDLE